MTTRDKTSSSASDHERLDAIRQLRQKADDGSTVAKIRLLVERFRALGGVPELSELAWGMCDENERLYGRLAALEHERDELLHSPVLQAVLDAIKGTIDTSTNIADHPNVLFAQMERLKLEKRAEHAEAAFLSLQTAVRKLEFELRCVSREGMSHGTGVGNYEMRGASRAFWNTADRLAALLPDPAGTSSSPKTDEDDQARVDGEQLVDHPRTAPTERR